MYFNVPSSQVDPSGSPIPSGIFSCDSTLSNCDLVASESDGDVPVGEVYNTEKQILPGLRIVETVTGQAFVYYVAERAIPSPTPSYRLYRVPVDGGDPERVAVLSDVIPGLETRFWLAVNDSGDAYVQTAASKIFRLDKQSDGVRVSEVANPSTYITRSSRGVVQAFAPSSPYAVGNQLLFAARDGDRREFLVRGVRRPVGTTFHSPAIVSHGFRFAKTGIVGDGPDVCWAVDDTGARIFCGDLSDGMTLKYASVYEWPAEQHSDLAQRPGWRRRRGDYANTRLHTRPIALRPSRDGRRVRSIPLTGEPYMGDTHKTRRAGGNADPSYVRSSLDRRRA